MGKGFFGNKKKLDTEQPPGTRPKSDNQGKANTCSTSALSKAVTAAFDDLGHDINQGVMTGLILNANKDINARFATDFHGITGHIKTKTGDYFFYTILVNKSSLSELKKDCEAQQGRFVINYKVKKQGQETLHCVYASKFDKKASKVDCINSWGKVWENPKVKKELVTDVYRVSVVLQERDQGEFVAMTNMPQQTINKEENSEVLFSLGVPGVASRQEQPSSKEATKGFDLGISAGFKHGVKSIFRWGFEKTSSW